MIEFRCIPIDTDVAERFRATGLDDAGNRLHRREPGSDSRCPCRHCLTYAQPGEGVLLGSYKLPKPLGVYWTPSPIFVHEQGCPLYTQVNHIPDIVRGSLISVRAYDEAHFCIYELGHVSEGADVDDGLIRALSDSRTAYVNIHTAKPGCLLCRAERV